MRCVRVWTFWLNLKIEKISWISLDTETVGEPQDVIPFCSLFLVRESAMCIGHSAYLKGTYILSKVFQQQKNYPIRPWIRRPTLFSETLCIFAFLLFCWLSIVSISPIEQNPESLHFHCALSGAALSQTLHCHWPRSVILCIVRDCTQSYCALFGTTLSHIVHCSGQRSVILSTNLDNTE